jgi:hypothetical protein
MEEELAFACERRNVRLSVRDSVMNEIVEAIEGI